MLYLGAVTLGPVPRVVVCLRDNTPPATLDAIAAAGADAVELRIDEFTDQSPAYVLEQIERARRLPIIATIRGRLEGGAWNRSEKERLELYRAVAPHVQALDIEFSSLDIAFEVMKIAAKSGALAIGSYHNFTETPVPEILEECAHQGHVVGADVAKVATLCTTCEDVLHLATFTAESLHPLISVGMGPYGALTRIILPALGSLLVYAACDRPTAPGQLSYQDTIAFLRAFYPDYNREKAGASPEAAGDR
ncbi:MAG TPA: type I 3-dehydroquinate dehydratase [Candidatus Hydrogenedentes bacterium]|nr:type I 3-dehydroquinate dehydratase [Candidatus Hydrogenedentota bacterium]HNT86692.1 type I 3-dehydroquinate dehydratase [Candidatus Hydrogenedentota bacterium]